MLERMTEGAKKVMVWANLEAERTHDTVMDTEHILWGLLKEESSGGVAILKNIDVDVLKMRREVEKLIKRRKGSGSETQLPPTSGAKRVLEFAVEEARSLGHESMGSEHLLLGLLRETDGVAGRVLSSYGVTVDGVRSEIVRMTQPKAESGAASGGGAGGGLSYEKAGVSIDTADAAKKQMADTMATKDPRILHRPGSFASLFDASFPGIKEPVLVMKTEEPGSKQKIAFAHGRRGGAASIAADMIHHLIDDIIVVGAQPVMVQDCIVCGKLQKDVVLELVKGINDACRRNDCFLIGGETSEQPGVLAEGLYILSSSIVGVVEKSKIIDGQKIAVGDVVIAVPSNGLHTNGYSLVRALMAQHPGLIDEEIVNEHGARETFLDAILKPHTCYYQAFKGLFGNADVHGIAHITGGGIAGNLNRILPADKDAVIDAGALRILPLFKRIRELGNVPEADMLRTFNVGIGMTIVCSPNAVDGIVRHLAGFDLKAYRIGEIVGGGEAVVKYRGNVAW
jgi:phosphoribosylformylglycinamidine cyclo-ligase